jgi:UDP-N-acetylglucosamine--N-acetylmuramyl-(pentapeptide) pyrophosphoryl-undecaprenol N-acetylglucosamine transferase
MKIILTGGGTGGHFYPLIAVVEEIENLTSEKKIVSPDLFFFAPAPYSDSILFDHKITFVQIPSGKIRRYFSFENITGILTTIKGFFVALWHLFRIYPDVVFGKGGYGSFPTLLAARLLFIPVVIHESDSKPGRVNAWAGKFAKYIAVSYPDAASYFKKERVAWTGNPLRREILSAGEISKEDTQASRDALDLEKDIPVILVVGGSQGAQVINDALLDTLPLLLDNYQIIHQAGPKNFEAVKNQSEVTLEKDTHIKRYKPFPYLSDDLMKKAYDSADLVISRAGSTIFEIAARGLPSIIIPIPERISHDQRTNAYNYKRVGGCVVIEEENLRPEIITAEIAKIMTHPETKQALIDGANKFARKDAAKVIADILISIGLTHEK